MKTPIGCVLRLLALSTLVMCLTAQLCAAKDPQNTPPLATTENLAAARAYYRSHAQVMLGPEQRLSNGIAWRLHIDAVTGMKQPRITWMPDAKRMRTANMLFEAIQGENLNIAAQMFEDREEAHESEGEYLRRLFEHKGKVEPKGSTPDEIASAMLFLRGLQRDVALTYASVNLVSAVSVLGSSLSRPVFCPKGVTFDLARGAVYDAMPCHSTNHYDYGVIANGGPHFMFRFGPLLKICDQTSYREFKRLYAEHAVIAAKAQALLVDKSSGTWTESQVQTCLDQYTDIDKYPARDYEFTFYLTAKGLAAHRSWFDSTFEMRNCTFVSPLNPTIIPWQSLAPLMQPGPWRDELLALH